MVFQKKSVSRNSLRPRRGGPAESHREYYVGKGSSGARLHWLPRFSRRVWLLERVGSLRATGRDCVRVLHPVLMVFNLGEQWRRATGRRDLLVWSGGFMCPDFRCGLLSPVSRLSRRVHSPSPPWVVGGVDGWSCADTRAIAASPESRCSFSGRRPAHCIVKPSPPILGRGAGEKCLLLGVVKLRRDGPHRVCQRVAFNQSFWEVGAFATRAWWWAEGLHSGWNARKMWWGDRGAEARHGRRSRFARHGVSKTNVKAIRPLPHGRGCGVVLSIITQPYFPAPFRGKRGGEEGRG